SISYIKFNLLLPPNFQVPAAPLILKMAVLILPIATVYRIQANLPICPRRFQKIAAAEYCQ
ncbi:MAG: hypothetical protein KJO26_13835, partial [Deltaproteobacteria bacterium]|nr:hypothetical protein [Deltaproteobacteria bacterium]